MPSSTDEAIRSLTALRRLGARLQRGEMGDDGRWLAGAIDRYLKRASVGLTLGGAVNIEPVPWWIVENRICRDAALREYAQRFLGKVGSGWARASALSLALRRYEAGQWLRDRKAERLPAGLEGTPRECLFRACRAHALDDGRPMPNSVKQIERILSASSS